MISVELLQEMIIGASRNLANHMEVVNKLNVFPVPDGDTGTNMSLTFSTATKELENTQASSVEQLAKTLSKACVNGARGNSGVILSQLVRGFALAVEGQVSLDGKGLAKGLQGGVATAYKGVMKPVEGTILTVAREAAAAAEQKARHGGSFQEVLEAVVTQGNIALAKTTEMLPILKQVGVVDAGGKGLMLIYEGALQVLKGEEVVVTEVSSEPSEAESLSVTDEVPLKLEDIEFGYCTEFKVRSKDSIEANLRAKLETMGDSVLVVGTEDMAKVHIHTNNPGVVLDLAMAYGELYDIKIDNMREQFRRLQASGVATPSPEPEQQTPITKALGVVAVASGKGLAEILSSTGVDVVVEGGQTSNPSTEEIAKAVMATPAEKVLILPNNKNIIMAAQQVAQVVDKEIAVVPSKSVPQGIASLMAFNPNKSLEDNQTAMHKVLSQVVTGEVTFAVRDTTLGDKAIAEGDLLGILDGQLEAVGQDIQATLIDLIGKVADLEGKELLTLYYGEDVTETEAQAIANAISERYDWLDVELYAGQQSLYYYLFSIE